MRRPASQVGAYTETGKRCEILMPGKKCVEHRERDTERDRERERETEREGGEGGSCERLVNMEGARRNIRIQTWRSRLQAAACPNRWRR